MCAVHLVEGQAAIEKGFGLDHLLVLIGPDVKGCLFLGSQALVVVQAAQRLDGLLLPGEPLFERLVAEIT